MGSANGLKKTGQKCRLWQGTIGQGHGGWNGIGKKLENGKMVPGITNKNSAKQQQKQTQISKLGRGWSK